MVVVVAVGVGAGRVCVCVNMVVGVLIYFTYSNLNSVMRSWITQGKVGFGVRANDHMDFASLVAQMA